ncbi:SIS domain-containing protein [Candidatus Bathyarchaeota archaeon]|nr:SIS domain-containing protein [Candidatus Bathyarchaeota archaeon]
MEMKVLTNPLRELVELPRETRASMGIEYTPKEIESQPKVWMKNFELLRDREDEIRSFIESKILQKKHVRVILSGAGTSGFIGLSVEGLLRKRWRRDIEAWPTTDIVTSWDSIFLRDVETTVISFARSGNSPESVGTILLANKFLDRVNHIVVTCNRHGKLAKMVEGDENVLLLVAPEEANDKGLAMTSSFTTMTSTAQFLAYIQDVDKYERVIKSLSEVAENLIEKYSGLLKEVSNLDFKRAFFLGSGALYGCAVESSLKLQEMTSGKVICKSDTFMGFRHGPEVAVDSNSLIVFYVSTDSFTRKYEIDLIEDIYAKNLGLVKIAVCDKSIKEIADYVDYVIEFNPEGDLDIPDSCRPMLDVIVAQTLALFKSLNLGLKPDNPSESGVITRVVKGVKIYDYEKFKKDGTFKVVAE